MLFALLVSPTKAAAYTVVALFLFVLGYAFRTKEAKLIAEIEADVSAEWLKLEAGGEADVIKVRNDIKVFFDATLAKIFKLKL